MQLCAHVDEEAIGKKKKEEDIQEKVVLGPSVGVATEPREEEKKTRSKNDGGGVVPEELRFPEGRKGFNVINK